MANVFSNWWTRVAGSLEDVIRLELTTQAEEMADAMRAAAPEGETGNLRKSIRVVQEPGRRMVVVLVAAGGPLTTKEVRGGSGVPYDYARATEFGTQNEPAESFFFPTYRARKKAIRAAVKERVKQALGKGII